MKKTLLAIVIPAVLTIALAALSICSFGADPVKVTDFTCTADGTFTFAAPAGITLADGTEVSYHVADQKNNNIKYDGTAVYKYGAHAFGELFARY